MKGKRVNINQGVEMSIKKELVSYTNKWNTRVVKHVPIHHHVNSKVAGGELKRAKEILKIDKSRISHAKSQLNKAEKWTGKVRG